jgi:hypothetical protein
VAFRSPLCALHFLHARTSADEAPATLPRGRACIDSIRLRIERQCLSKSQRELHTNRARLPWHFGIGSGPARDARSPRGGPRLRTTAGFSALRRVGLTPTPNLGTGMRRQGWVRRELVSWTWSNVRLLSDASVRHSRQSSNVQSAEPEVAGGRKAVQTLSSTQPGE